MDFTVLGPCCTLTDQHLSPFTCCSWKWDWFSPAASQVRVVANPSKPSQFHTHCSEMAPDGLSLLLIHDRTDILTNFDGQPGCLNPGNMSLSAVHLPALFQQERKTPVACLRLCGTLDQQHSTVCCLWTSNPHCNHVPHTPQLGETETHKPEWQDLTGNTGTACLQHIIIGCLLLMASSRWFQVHEEHLCSSRKMFPVLWVAMVGLSSFRLSQMNPDDLVGDSHCCLTGV